MHLKIIKEYSAVILNGIINSYAQVFFSQNTVFGLFLLVVTLFSGWPGIAGLISILMVQSIVFLFGFDTNLLKDGTYSYNAMLSGIALGSFFEPGAALLLTLVASTILSFLLTQWFLGSLGRNYLPILTVPFLVTVWIIILGAGNFTALHFRAQTEGLAQINFPYLFDSATSFISRLPYANVVYLYLRSLGAILFQYNDLSGLIIASGLLLNSRMAFVLSLFGFAIGYAFYQFMEGDFSQLIYTYIGFNFILTAIALGGFFIVPSRRSFVNLLFTIPVIALLISALHAFLYVRFGLPLYSLPFNIVVILFLASMQKRVKSSGLNLVTVQKYSPEKHHYDYYSNSVRYQRDTLIQVALPVMGEWTISQSHDGEITHKTEWKHAWDFDVRDERGLTFYGTGRKPEDYYCFNLPVLAPADGTVAEVEDGIDDNEIGKVNLDQNWGNTIVIRHGDYLYSKLSHFRKNSIRFKKGDFVRKGDIIGYCGNSGRSPEPHLHIQFQATPYIGSPTLLYPFSYYITSKGKEYTLRSYDIPARDEKVSNLRITKLLTSFFGFIPGQIFSIKSDLGREETWEVMVTPLNQTYLWCPENKSLIWFVNNGAIFYCTAFEGDRNSCLYQFFLAAYKVPLGYYSDLVLRDHISILNVSAYWIRFLHDFTAPFFHYLKAEYNFKFISTDNEHSPSHIVYAAEQNQRFFGRFSSRKYFRCHIESRQIRIECGSGKNTEILTCQPVC